MYLCHLLIFPLLLIFTRNVQRNLWRPIQPFIVPIFTLPQYILQKAVTTLAERMETWIRNMDITHGIESHHPWSICVQCFFMTEIKYWLKTLITLVHHPQKVYERFWLPRIRPLRCDYFNKSQSENPCIKISQLRFVLYCLVLLV